MMLIPPPKKYPLQIRPSRYIYMHSYKQDEPLYETNTTTPDIYSVNKYPTLFESCSNPIHVFIFLILFSIWFGGFTRRQIYDFLNKN
jgi:hypothetical protein